MILRLCAAWMVGLAVLPSAGAASTPSQIPAVQTTSLAGQTVQLPQAFQGKVEILVLGFSKASRDGVTVWGRRVAQEYNDAPKVGYYELAMLAEVPRLVRGVVIRAIRSSVPEPVQARFLPLTEDEAAWREVAHYSRPDDPYVLVVDQRGRVLWQTEGPETEASYAELKQHVEQQLEKAEAAR